MRETSTKITCRYCIFKLMNANILTCPTKPFNWSISCLVGRVQKVIKDGGWLAHLEGLAGILLGKVKWMKFPLPSLFKIVKPGALLLGKPLRWLEALAQQR